MARSEYLFTLPHLVAADRLKVTELGGALSHSSIVAREYSIPAVISTGLATQRILDGQTITVGGTIGKVLLNATVGRRRDSG